MRSSRWIFLLGFSCCFMNPARSESPLSPHTAVPASAEKSTPQDSICIGESEKILHLYNWADYVPKILLERFEKETGIHIVYSVFDSVEVLEAQLLLDTRYDVVFPSAWPVFVRGIATHRFMPLNKKWIPNLRNIDPNISKKLGDADQNMTYGVPYLFGTVGIGYDRNALLARAPNAPLDSWALLFDPRWAQLIKDGHIFLLDSITDVLQAVLLYLGKSPNSQDPKIWDTAVEHIMKVRPYIDAFEGSKQIENLLTGNNEIIQVFSDLGQKAAEENTNPNRDIRYIIPKEGSVIWIDMMAIPHNAPHPQNAHLFLNFILRPENIALCSNEMKGPNAVPASYDLIDPTLRANPIVFPTAETMKRIYPDFAPSRELSRHLCRQWCKIKMDYRPNSSLWSFWSFWPFSKLCKKENPKP